MGLQDTEIKGQMTGRIKGTRLTVVKFSHRDDKYRKIMLFRCDCGNYKKIRLHHVQRMEIKSCGCLQKEFKHPPDHMEKMRASPKRLPNLRKVKASTPSERKGKIRIEVPAGSKKYKYITEQELFSIYYGVEVESLRLAPPPHNKGKKFINGAYQAIDHLAKHAKQ